MLSALEVCARARFFYILLKLGLCANVLVSDDLYRDSKQRHKDVTQPRVTSML